jgi:protocatechuate 3,4-dioxygenase beta subunit
VELKRAVAVPVAALAALGWTLPAPAASSAPAACRPTKSDPVGPFERTAAVFPRRAKIGTGHVLVGRVLRSPDCKPIAGAVVEFWQAGPKGYAASGRGSVVTDRSGRFRFEGPVPASDGGFPPHIHILVHYGGYEDLLVRYEVPGGQRVGRLTLVMVSPL